MNLSQKLESKVMQTIKKYKLCNKGEKIIVAVSGGKDSSVTAYLLHKFDYNIELFHINLRIGGYSERCLNAAKELSKLLNVKLHIYDMKKEMGSGMCYLRTAIQTKSGKIKLKNCAICGVIKKWILNKIARELKADKLATGHNLDDEAQTFLMNIFKGSPKLSANTGPITRNLLDKRLKFVPRIKPLFYVAENDVRVYSKEKKLPVVYEKCPCALDSYRIQVRKFVNTLTEKEKQNIMNNFDSLIKRIEKIKDTRIEYCEVCGEPARNKLCKKCELVKT